MLRRLILLCPVALSACGEGRPAVEWPELIPAGIDLTFGTSPEDLARGIEQREQLTQARAVLLRDPTDETAIIWYGRRMAYLGYFDNAVEIYATGLELYPDSAKLLRHRGHRYITLRKLDQAARDYERAAELIRGQEDEVEPDGQPNSRNIPTSTLHTNIWYHYGLAQYLRGELESAATCYANCLSASTNHDMEVAARYWLYLTLERLGRSEQAEAVLEPLAAEWHIIENHAYHRLLRLYKGELGLDAFAAEKKGTTAAGTLGYGIARYHLIRGERERGAELLREVVAAGPSNAFGCIAAEADLQRAQASQAPATRR